MENTTLLRQILQIQHAIVKAKFMKGVVSDGQAETRKKRDSGKRKGSRNPDGHECIVFGGLCTYLY